MYDEGFTCTTVRMSSHSSSHPVCGKITFSKSMRHFANLSNRIVSEGRCFGLRRCSPFIWSEAGPRKKSPPIETNAGPYVIQTWSPGNLSFSFRISNAISTNVRIEREIQARTGWNKLTFMGAKATTGGKMSGL